VRAPITTARVEITLNLDPDEQFEQTFGWPGWRMPDQQKQRTARFDRVEVTWMSWNADWQITVFGHFLKADGSLGKQGTGYRRIEWDELSPQLQEAVLSQAEEIVLPSMPKEWFA
jgi:hypothetical protein